MKLISIIVSLLSFVSEMQVTDFKICQSNTLDTLFLKLVSDVFEGYLCTVIFNGDCISIKQHLALTLFLSSTLEQMFQATPIKSMKFRWKQSTRDVVSLSLIPQMLSMVC